MPLSVVLPTTVPVTAVSLVSAGSFSNEICHMDKTGIQLQQFIEHDCETSSVASDDSTFNSDNQDISFRSSHQKSTDSLFSLSSETICSLPSSYHSSLNWSSSSKEALDVRNNLGIKLTPSSILEFSVTKDNLRQRKSSLSSLKTLSPTEYHPLNADYQLDSKSEDYSPLKRHTILTQQRSKNPFSASKLISFAKQLGKITFKPKDFVSETVSQCNNDKWPTPLQTFSQNFESLPLFQEKVVIDDPNWDTLLPLHFSGKINRIREQRYNSNYLLIYSLDKNIQKYFIQVEENEINTFDQLLLDNYEQLKSEPSNTIPADHIFDAKFKSKILSVLQLQNDSKIYDENFIRLLKLASIARYKLWSAITLPPRSDKLPNISNLNKTIIPTASLESCEVPWLSLEDIKKGKAIKKLSNSAGFLRNSNIQFVSKNSQSKRWISYVNST